MDILQIDIPVLSYLSQPSQSIDLVHIYRDVDLGFTRKIVKFDHSGFVKQDNYVGPLLHDMLKEKILKP